MGCEWIKTGVVGGLRLSVERRRMANAKMSTMRYRRYQTLHNEIQEEEMRKTREILESRKKERERLNQYMHLLHQPHVKLLPTSKNHHKYGSVATRSALNRRPPWKLSLIQDQKVIMHMRQKEISLANPSLCALRQEDYDAMLQVRATATRDAIVDLRACNSRYPLPNINRVATPQTEDGYLKNHLLRGSSLHSEYSKHEIDHFNNEEIMNKNNSTETVGMEIFPIETQFVHTNASYKVMEGLPLTPNPSRQTPNDVENVSYTHCKEKLHDNEKILSDITTEAPIVKTPTKSLVTMSPQRQWYHMDVEKTSFVTEELFLASLENEGATKRLIQQITAIDQSNPCKLTTLNSLNDISGCGSPYESTEIKFAHDKLDTMDQLLLIQRLHKGVTNLHSNEITVGAHETNNNERPMSNSTISKRSNTLGRHSPNSHIENTKSSIITKNMVKVKVESQAELEDNQMDDYLSKGSKAATSTRERLLEPTINVHDNARISGQQNSSTHDHPSLCSEWHNTKQERERDKRESLAGTRVPPHAESVAESFEDRGQNDASTMINQHNKSISAQRSRHGPRKVNIPQKILKSVYERCDLDSVRPPGYTILCNAQPKGRPIKHSKDNIQMSIRAPSPLRNEPMPLQPENADAINHQSTSKEERNICHDDASGNKENIANGNEYVDLCSKGSDEELNILASLERLDYKLATINAKSLNNERNSMNSRQLSSKSTQSAPPVLIQRGTASSSLGKNVLVTGKQKNFLCNPPRPSSTKSPFRKPPHGLRQRQVIGITNKCKAKPHELQSESPINYPPVVFPNANYGQPATSSFRGP